MDVKTTQQMNQQFYNSLPKKGEQYICYKESAGWNKKTHKEKFKWQERVVQPWNLNGENHISELVNDNFTFRSTYISLAQYLGGDGTIRAIKEGRKPEESLFYAKRLSRSFRNAICIDRVVIDIDPGNHFLNFSDEQIELILDLLQNFHILPDFVISSGHGVQVVFCFTPLGHITRRLTRKYDEVVAALSYEIESLIQPYFDISVDRLKLNAVYRLPGTYNATAERRANVIFCGYSEKRNSFNDLCELLGVPVMQNGVHSRKSEEAVEKNQKKFNTDRSDERYEQERNRFAQKMKENYVFMATYLSESCSVVPTGYRNNFIYCFCRNIAQAVPNQYAVFAMAMSVNNHLTRPLSESEVKTICRSAISDYQKTGRIYSFESQLQWLKKHHDVFCCISDWQLSLPTSEEQRQKNKKQSIQKAHKAESERRKEERRKSKTEKINEVKQLHREGKTVTEIQKLTGITRPTIYKYIGLPD